MQNKKQAETYASSTWEVAATFSQHLTIISAAENPRIFKYTWTKSQGVNFASQNV